MTLSHCVNDGRKVTLWVIRVILGVLADVGSSPNNDQTTTLRPYKKCSLRAEPRSTRWGGHDPAEIERPAHTRLKITLSTSTCRSAVYESACQSRQRSRCKALELPAAAGALRGPLANCRL